MPDGWRRLARRLAAVVLSFGAASAGLAILFWAVESGSIRSTKSASGRSVGPIGPIAVEPSDLDIAEVWETTYHRHPVRIRNISSEPVTIDGFEVSCRTCMDVEEAGLTLGPGESGLIHLKFEFWYRYLSQFHDATRPLKQQLRPIFADEHLNRSTRGQWWDVVGTIRSRATVRAMALDFGDTLVRGGKPVRRKLDVRVHVPHERLEAVSYHPGVGVRFQPEAEGEGRYMMIVEPSPLLALGPFQTEIHVWVHEAGGGREWAFMLPVYGDVQPPVRLVPSRLFLGMQRMGATAEEYVRIVRPAPLPPMTVRVRHGSPAIEVTPVPSDADAPDLLYRLRVPIRNLGWHQEIISFELTCESPERQALELPIEYYGMSRGDVTGQ